MTLANFDPPCEIRDELYEAVLQCAVDECLPWALLVVRDDDELEKSARLVLDELDPFRVGGGQASTWPGKQLSGHTAFVFRYRFGAEMAAVLSGAAAGLFEWLEPSLPEDPSFLRDDGSAWLTTIAHERDAYFTLTADERQRLLRAAPDLRAARPFAGSVVQSEAWPSDR